MKIALVDNLLVGGGLSRFTFMLSKKIVEHNKSIHIDYYVNEGNIIRTPELKNLPSQVNIKLLESTKLIKPEGFTRNLLKRAKRRLNLKEQILESVQQEIERKVVGYDLAYFPVAHMMAKPNLKVPICGTIHDFNWKYFFGRQTFPLHFVQEMDKEIVEWFTTSKNACSSYDVVTEANKLYPNVKKNLQVIHLAPLVFSEGTDDAVAEKILHNLKIDYPYIIFPGNFFPHKNHLNLFTAFHELKKKTKFKNFKLILTGLNTDQIPAGTAERLGVRLNTDSSSPVESDIIGLGYQPNQVVEVLIKKAKLLVSPSIYEAICTPGMDAWYYGTPTAISNIPPFKEHEEVWGIKSAYFDPMDVDNIVSVIDSYLTNYTQAQNDGQLSKANISKYSWDIVAQKYLAMFESV